MATLSRITAAFDGEAPRPTLALVPGERSTEDLRDGAASDARFLYRVVGPHELAMLEAEEWSSVPRRVNWSVILFKFMAYDDALDLLLSKPSGRNLAIVEVPVDAAYADALRVELPDRLAGRTEYWVEADRLDDLNAHLRGPIRRVR